MNVGKKIGILNNKLISWFVLDYGQFGLAFSLTLCQPSPVPELVIKSLF